MEVQKRPAALLSQPKTYRMTSEAVAAVEKLAIALNLPLSKVMELAILRLEEEWRAGRVKGIGLLVGSGSNTDD